MAAIELPDSRFHVVQVHNYVAVSGILSEITDFIAGLTYAIISVVVKEKMEESFTWLLKIVQNRQNRMIVRCAGMPRIVRQALRRFPAHLFAEIRHSPEEIRDLFRRGEVSV